MQEVLSKDAQSMCPYEPLVSVHHKASEREVEIRKQALQQIDAKVAQMFEERLSQERADLLTHVMKAKTLPQ